MPATPLPLARRLRGLYGIVGPVDGADASDETLLALADALLAAGCPVLQLRHKSADGRRLLALARALRVRTDAAGALLVVNDRVDVALMADADGVHVGQTDLPVEEVRRLAAALRPGRPLIVGLSTHDLPQVQAGMASGADYLGFGPVFGTASKDTGYDPRGIALLARAVLAAGETPVVAIGGVGLANASLVAEAGAAMGAVISDVARAGAPVERARALGRVLGGGRG